MTGRERLLLVGELLWGRRWQTAMQEELKVSRRTLSRYLTAGRPVREFLLQELDAVMVYRIGKMADALDGTAVLMLDDGRPVVFNAKGEPFEPEGTLRDRLRGVLEEIKIHALKGPADAAE